MERQKVSDLQIQQSSPRDAQQINNQQNIIDCMLLQAKIKCPSSNPLQYECAQVIIEVSDDSTLQDIEAYLQEKQIINKSTQYIFRSQSSEAELPYDTKLGSLNSNPVQLYCIEGQRRAPRQLQIESPKKTVVSEPNKNDSPVQSTNQRNNPEDRSPSRDHKPPQQMQAALIQNQTSGQLNVPQQPRIQQQQITRFSEEPRVHPQPSFTEQTRHVQQNHQSSEQSKSFPQTQFIQQPQYKQPQLINNPINYHQQNQPPMNQPTSQFLAQPQPSFGNTKVSEQVSFAHNQTRDSISSPVYIPQTRPQPQRERPIVPKPVPESSDKTCCCSLM